MKCFYIIKLPNGGEVKIPADLTKLTPNRSFTKTFRKLFRFFRRN